MKKISVILFIIPGFFCVPAQAFQDPNQIATLEKAAYQQSQESAQRQNSVASSNFDVHFYRCLWEVDPSVRFITGTVTSYFTITAASNSIIFDFTDALTIDSVLFRGNKVGFQLSALNGLTVDLAQTLPAAQKDSVSIFYHGIPENNGFGSFVTSTQNGTPVMWTLSEPYGAKDWWPCKNSSTDKADSIDIQLTYPAIYNSSSNGLLFGQWVQNGKKTSYWKHRYPIASYLVAFAITDYAIDIDSARIGNNYMPLLTYAFPYAANDFKDATRTAKLCLEKFSSLFGPYPFNKESYSQTQFGWGGGMEHQTNSFINSSYNQLVAHELGHQWFGDKITCASWQDIWLNEGFGQYMQFIYLQNFDTSLVRQYLDNIRKRVTSLPSGSVKVNDTTNVNRIFDGRLSYSKGSCLIHMIRWRLGDSLFFSAMRKYLNDPSISYGTVRTYDLQRNLEQASGQNFTEFFQDWYEGEGFPSYQVEWSVNTNNWVKIRLNQTTSHPSVSFYEMPVPIRFSGPGGRDTTVALNHTKNAEEFWINLPFTPDIAIFDPELWLLSDKNKVTKISETASQNNLVKIFPNPASNFIRVSIENPSGNNISIGLFSASAQLLYSKTFELSGRDELIEIPVRSLPTGIYWLSVKGGNLKVGKKIMIKGLP